MDEVKDQPKLDKNHYARMVCLFLAEGLRTRNMGLRRAGEIAEKVLQNMNLLDNERDFLMLVKELAKDFDEMTTLEKKLIMDKEKKEKRDMERIVKDFSVQSLSGNSHQALSLLQDATGQNVTLEELEKKYPDFKEFVEEHGGK